MKGTRLRMTLPHSLSCMGLNITGLMERLARVRPIFHSEAGFQHALAWQIQTENPTARVRLETRPERGIRLDILIGIDQERVAIELKYLVARFEGLVAGERFELPNQGAHDISRHDVLKDVVRVERFVTDRVVESGWAVALSNDSNYWRPGTKSDPIDAMFRIHDGRRLQGLLEWSPRAGAGTTKGRDKPLVLDRVYSCGWRDYSTVIARDGRTVTLRYLAFEISPRSS